MKSSKIIKLSLAIVILCATIFFTYSYTLIQSRQIVFDDNVKNYTTSIACYQSGKMVSYDTYLHDIDPPAWAMNSKSITGIYLSVFTLSKNGGDTMCRMEKGKKV